MDKDSTESVSSRPCWIQIQVSHPADVDKTVVSKDAVFPVFHALSTYKLVTSVSVTKRVGLEILALACVLLHIEKSLKIKPLPSRSHKHLFGM